MPTVREILARKGVEVVTVHPSDTVRQAAQIMNQRGLGGVVVVESNELTGIFTERDVLRRVVGEGRDPGVTTVAEVMTRQVITCTPLTSLEECAALMTARRLRHLPVLDGNALAGVVTIGDVLAFQVSEQQATIQYMSSYVYDLR